jgi:hypothetical protein
MKGLLKKYGSFSKIPPAELAGAAADMGQMGDQVARDINAALAQNVAPAPKHDGAWIEHHDVSVPGFDAKRADTQALLALAMAQAKRDVPDAVLIRFDLENVHPDGTADLTLPVGIRNADLMYRFQSPSHAKPDPNKPRGSTPAPCQFQLSVDQSSATILPMLMCNERPAGPPHCTVKEIWKRALAKHPDLGDAVAQIDYMSNIVSGRTNWSFTVGEAPHWLASELFADDCR